MKKSELKNIIKEEIQKITESDIRRKQELADVALDIVRNGREESIIDETIDLYNLSATTEDTESGETWIISDEFGNIGEGENKSDALYDWALNLRFDGIVGEPIDEISTTASVPGYQTPNFLTKSGKTNDNTYKVLGYQDVPKKKLNTKPLSEVAYKEYKNDATKTQKAKVQDAINQINGQLYRLERVINQNLRLKTESAISHEAFNEGAKTRLNKIMERLTKLQHKIRNFGE